MSDSGENKLIRSAGRAYRKNIQKEFDTQLEYEEGYFWLECAKKDGFTNNTVTDCGLTISEIASIIFGLKQANIDKIMLEHSLKDADAAWTRRSEAREIMTHKEMSHKERMSLALSHLKLIGEKHNKDGQRKNHEVIACAYHALRTGNGYHVDGQLKQLKEPKSHNDAVYITEETFNIDWDSLQRACRRKGIELTVKSDLFPVP